MFIDRREFLIALSSLTAASLPSVALAGTAPVQHIVYPVPAPATPVAALDHLQELRTQLGADVGRALFIAVRGTDRVVVYDRSAVADPTSAEIAARVAARHDQLLRAALDLGERAAVALAADEIAPAYNIAYGKASDRRTTDSLYRKVVALLGRGMEKGLEVQSLGESKYQLVYRRIGTLDRTTEVAAKHRVLLASLRIDITPVAEANHVVVHDGSSATPNSAPPPQPAAQAAAEAPEPTTAASSAAEPAASPSSNAAASNAAASNAPNANAADVGAPPHTAPIADTAPGAGNEPVAGLSAPSQPLGAAPAHAPSVPARADVVHSAPAAPAATPPAPPPPAARTAAAQPTLPSTGAAPTLAPGVGAPAGASAAAPATSLAASPSKAAAPGAAPTPAASVAAAPVKPAAAVTATPPAAAAPSRFLSQIREVPRPVEPAPKPAQIAASPTPAASTARTTTSRAAVRAAAEPTPMPRVAALLDEPEDDTGTLDDEVLAGEDAISLREGEAPPGVDPTDLLAAQPERPLPPIGPPAALDSSELRDGTSDLEARIEAYIKAQRGLGRVSGDDRTGWLVYDLYADRMLASVHIDEPMQAASMIKPFVAVAFFHEVERGRLNYGAESQLHMERMIRDSSNESTNWLIERTGGPAACHRLLHARYGEMVDQLSLVEYIPSGGRTYRNLASPADHARLLKGLWRGTLPQVAELRRVMNLPGADRLYHGVAEIPAGTQIYNKTGTTAMCCGDMGVLVARRPDDVQVPYIVVGIVDRQTRASSYTSWSRTRADVIRRVSGITYEFLREQYGLV